MTNVETNIHYNYSFAYDRIQVELNERKRKLKELMRDRARANRQNVKINSGEKNSCHFKNDTQTLLLNAMTEIRTVPMFVEIFLHFCNISLREKWQIAFVVFSVWLSKPNRVFFYFLRFRFFLNPMRIQFTSFEYLNLSNRKYWTKLLKWMSIEMKRFEMRWLCPQNLVRFNVELLLFYGDCVNRDFCFTFFSSLLCLPHSRRFSFALFLFSWLCVNGVLVKHKTKKKSLISLLLKWQTNWKEKVAPERDMNSFTVLLDIHCLLSTIPLTQ